MDGFDDVGAFTGENCREHAGARPDGPQVNAYAEEAAVFDQAALDDLGQERNVDIAARDEDDSAAMAEIGLGLKRAARAAAPAPSARVFSCSSSMRMALAISSSSTVTISST